ncbi:MAG TPA: DinB family protein [Flavitalea sp.]|nr:DinB family protein [Flavitalea sp.]
MKKVFIATLAFIFFSFVITGDTISKKERIDATDLLRDTHTALLKSLEGLNEAQLNYKVSDSTWSVDGNVKHLAAVEQTILGMVEDALKKPANPDKRADIKISDEQLIKNYENRTKKVKTLPSLEPQNITFVSTSEALASLKQNREKAINFINTTKEDLRNHVIKYPFGSYDCYQSILILGSHMNRHTQQIHEVKSQAEFPKN